MRILMLNFFTDGAKITTTFPFCLRAMCMKRKHFRSRQLVFASGYSSNNPQTRGANPF